MKTRQTIILETVQRLFEIDRKKVASNLGEREAKLRALLNDMKKSSSTTEEQLDAVRTKLRRLNYVKGRAEGKPGFKRIPT
jgi:chaperonin cofactor prefoldin